MHLGLNHLMENETYAAFMEKCGREGDWITLDNSAHEFHSGQPIEDLLVNAIRIHARELVIPDVLFHSMQTVESGRAAFKFLADSTLYKACSPSPLLMVVPQGRDEIDWAWCLKTLVADAEAYGLGGLVTVGLSKDYEEFPGGLRKLIDKYLMPLYAQKQILTHLLGWTCNWDLIRFARDYHCLRSTDSAKPFIYAYDGIKLHHDKVPPKRRRPEDYFEFPRLETLGANNDLLEIAFSNATAFKLAARGVKIRSDEDALVAGA